MRLGEEASSWMWSTAKERSELVNPEILRCSGSEESGQADNQEWARLEIFHQEIGKCLIIKARKRTGNLGTRRKQGEIRSETCKIEQTIYHSLWWNQILIKHRNTGDSRGSGTQLQVQATEAGHHRPPWRQETSERCGALRTDPQKSPPKRVVVWELLVL